MTRNSLFEIMQSTSVIDRTEPEPEKAPPPVECLLFTDDVKALYIFQNQIKEKGKQYKFTGWQTIMPLSSVIYRTLRDAHHTCKAKAETLIIFKHPNHLKDTVTCAETYIRQTERLAASSQAKIRHNEALQLYLSETNVRLERLAHKLKTYL